MTYQQRLISLSCKCLMSNIFEMQISTELTRIFWISTRVKCTVAKEFDMVTFYTVVEEHLFIYKKYTETFQASSGGNESPTLFNLFFDYIYVCMYVYTSTDMKKWALIVGFLMSSTSSQADDKKETI